jgi:hypothetical protein
MLPAKTTIRNRAHSTNPENYSRRVEQANLMDIDPEKRSPEQLDCIANHLIKKAPGDNPAAIAEARRRIDAGQVVTIDPACQAVNEPTRTTLEPEESQKP